MLFSRRFVSIPAHPRLTDKAKRHWASINKAWKFAMLGLVIVSSGLAVRFYLPNARFVFVPIYMVGFPFILGGGLFAFRPRIGQVRQQDFQKSIRFAWYTAALCVPTIELGLAISLISGTRAVGQYIVVWGMGAFLVLPWVVYSLSIVIINEGFRTTAAVSLITAVSIFALPPLLAYLGTNGSHFVPFLGPRMTGITGYIASLTLMLIPVFLFVFPDMIRQRLIGKNVEEQEGEKNVEEQERERKVEEQERERKVEEQERVFVLGWLVGLATVATALYGTFLHFSDSPLAKVPLGQIIVPNLFVAALLQPLYKRIATACWERGILELVSLRGWRAQQLKSWRLVKESWRKEESDWKRDDWE